MNGVANGVFTGDTLLGLNNGPWIDWSEQATYTGWSTITTKQIRYKVVGNMVFIIFYIIGTSNSTSTNFTVPFAHISSTTFALNMCYVQDNGTNNIGTCWFVTQGNVLTFQRWSAATTFTTWTASGTKSLQGEIYYQISQ